MKVNYKDLKMSIIKCCKPTKGNDCTEFIIDKDSIVKRFNEKGLYVLDLNSFESKKILASDIPFISEYLKDGKLSWLDAGKEFTTVTFVDMESADEDLLSKLNSLESCDVDEKVKLTSEILSRYKCYNAMIVSYISNEPTRFGKISYEIACRANKVVLKEKYKNEEGKE